MSQALNEISAADRMVLFATLEERFEMNLDRHQGVPWETVQAKLESAGPKLWSLNEMERTGGEPDVVGQPGKNGELMFIDCSAESPKGRRSVCYDREAWESRKEHKPGGTAVDMANEMGIDLLTEDQYQALQGLGEFDLKTSSWLRTPENVRKLGGAIFADRRYDRVFIFHNGADSYYAARGFRASLRI